jgi:hypothetical protein
MLFRNYPDAWRIIADALALTTVIVFGSAALVAIFLIVRQAQWYHKIVNLFK